MCEKEKDFELYRNKISRDNLIEIAIIQYFNKRSNYQIEILEYENGHRIRELKLEQNTEETKKKFIEITKPKSLIWERKDASEMDFDKLENCYGCVDSDKCMGCNVFTLYINVALIS